MADVHDFIGPLKNVLEERIKPLEERLRVKSGFFEGLLKEKDDWSFIIKIHSLVEAAVSHYLSVKIGNKNLESVFQRLPLSTANGGKIDFLKALDLLKEHRGFIVLLSRIRNDYVHVVSNVSLRFEDYFDSNGENFKTLLNTVFKNAVFKVVTSALKKPKMSYFVKKMPAFCIWILTMLLLIEAYDGIKPRQVIPSRGRGLPDIA